LCMQFLDEITASRTQRLISIITNASTAFAIMSPSRAKRKVAQIGEQALSAAVGDVVARTMSAVAGRYDAHASVDGQLERLATLLVMVHSAVDEAERVHVANWWLRRWLWRLRYAALDGDEVLRSMRQQRAADEAAEATATTQSAGGRLWNAATRVVVRSAKSLLVSSRSGGDVDRLRRTVERLEQACARLGDFLKLLELEIMRSQAPPPPAAAAAAAAAPETRGCSHDGDTVEDFVSDTSSQPDTSLDDGSESEHDDDLTYIISREHISQADYIGCTAAIGLQIVTRKIQRAAGKLRTMPPAPPVPGTTDTDTGDCPAPEPADTAWLRGMVADIREAVRLGDRTEVNAERRWLAEWRRELQAVADRADRVLLASPSPVASLGAGGDDEVARMVRSLETAAAHLRAYVTLLRFAVVVVESR
jgi:hypothetical protein